MDRNDVVFSSAKPLVHTDTERYHHLPFRGVVVEKLEVLDHTSMEVLRVVVPLDTEVPNFILIGMALLKEVLDVAHGVAIEPLEAARWEPHGDNVLCDVFGDL